MRKSEQKLNQSICQEVASLKEQIANLEQQIAESRHCEEDREKLINMLDAASDVVLTANPDRSLRFVNKAGQIMLGWHENAGLQGRTMDEVHPHWAIELLEKVALPAARSDGIWRGTTAILAGNSKEIPVSQVIVAHKTKSGTLDFFSIIMRDIRDRKEIEAALRESEERFRRLSEAAFEVIVISDKGRILDVNDQFEDLYGYHASEAIGMEVWDLIAEKSLDLVRERISCGYEKPYEAAQQRKDGSVFWARVSGKSIPYKGRKVRVTAIQDITEHRLAEAKIRQMNIELEHRVKNRTAELEAANKELESFAYSVSHDLRAPVRAINGFSQALLEEYADTLGTQGQSYLNRVRNASRRMGQLIDDLLTLSRITRSQMTREKVDLSKIADEITAELKQAQPEREVRFKISSGIEANGDAKLLRVVLDNLLGNAWKFTQKRDVATINFGVSRHNSTTTFYVQDDGAGFDMKYADKLFGPFQRLHNETEFAGTGIGLATVQRIIRRHGGSIWAKAEVDKGATFYFTL